MDIQLRNQAADDAGSRYQLNAASVEQMRSGIRKNRGGLLQLTDIGQDTERLRKRIARESLPEEQAYERINGVANFQDVCIVKKIMRMADSVCRISTPNNFGSTSFGTGFLIAPGIIITNHHVFPSAEEAAQSQAEFFYELNEAGRPGKTTVFRLRPDKLFLTSSMKKVAADPNSGLDFSLVALEEESEDGIKAESIDHVVFDRSLGKILEGENCIVVQHPAGDYKKVVLKDIRLITFDSDFLIYESDTLPGSSGSMVIGLGTGEIVGLHHSGVPRKNAQGQWLRRDGTVASDTDRDDVIDWIGNEGIRVSSIVRAVNEMKVPKEMKAMHTLLLQAFANKIPDTNLPPAAKPKPHMETKQKEAAASVQQLLSFEVVIAAQPLMEESWQQQKHELIPGLKTAIRLFPQSTDENLRRCFYITVESSENPWQLAAALQTLPQIETCIPDEAVPTHTEPVAGRSQHESSVFGEESDEQNWKKFETNWAQTSWFKKASEVDATYVRQWNWIAVNARKVNLANEPAIQENLPQLRLAQLDTGYSQHSKNRDGYDLDHDYDTIDDDTDALDSQSDGLLKHPGHGTRTASLVVGTLLANDPRKCNGNRGLLTLNDRPLTRLWPYRVSKSVILLGRVRNMVDAANRAVDSGVDVMFMCMGIYPRPIIDAAAKYAYDNGVIWVCAAGNYVKVVVAPAVCPGTIAVAAVNPANEPWSQSSYGPQVDIAAPGEDVYVPVVSKDGTESMRYGSGTSYATPHVAAAAMLWKAKHKSALNKYREPWQIVEAFRYCLKESAGAKETRWAASKLYGAGLLDLEKLLAKELPDPGNLVYAYKGKSTRPGWDLGIVEAISSIWQSISRNVWGREEAARSTPLTERGWQGLQALGALKASAIESSSGELSPEARERILRTYFESYS